MNIAEQRLIDLQNYRANTFLQERSRFSESQEQRIARVRQEIANSLTNGTSIRYGSNDLYIHARQIQQELINRDAQYAQAYNLNIAVQEAIKRDRLRLGL
jgi:spermidine/putrescine-binding protein